MFAYTVDRPRGYLFADVSCGGLIDSVFVLLVLLAFKGNGNVVVLYKKKVFDYDECYERQR